MTMTKRQQLTCLFQIMGVTDAIINMVRAYRNGDFDGVQQAMQMTILNYAADLDEPQLNIEIKNFIRMLGKPFVNMEQINLKHSKHHRARFKFPRITIE